jgi:hypothetical protein
VLAEGWEMVAAPATTDPPCGSTLWANAGPSNGSTTIDSAPISAVDFRSKLPERNMVLPCHSDSDFADQARRFNLVRWLRMRLICSFAACVHFDS